MRQRGGVRRKPRASVRARTRPERRSCARRDGTYRQAGGSPSLAGGICEYVSAPEAQPEGVERGGDQHAHVSDYDGRTVPGDFAKPCGGDGWEETQSLVAEQS